MGRTGVLPVGRTAPRTGESRQRVGRLSRGGGVGLSDPVGRLRPDRRICQLVLQTNGLALVTLEDVRRRSAVVELKTLEDEPTKSFVQLVDGHADRFAAPPALGQAASWPPVVRLTGGLQVSQNGEHASVILCGGREPELREDARHVL